MTEAEKYGERKHETCRFGTLNPGFMMRPPIEFDEPMVEKPILMPICNWRIPEPAPPAATRVWGGAVEYARDCAVCVAHQPVGEGR